MPQGVLELGWELRGLQLPPPLPTRGPGRHIAHALCGGGLASLRLRPSPQVPQPLHCACSQSPRQLSVPAGTAAAVGGASGSGRSEEAAVSRARWPVGVARGAEKVYERPAAQAEALVPAVPQPWHSCRLTWKGTTVSLSTATSSVPTCSGDPA